MKLSPKRLEVLEKLYFEGPTTDVPTRQLNELGKMGLIEVNEIDGWIEPDEFFRISPKGKKALDDYYEFGTVYRHHLETMTCAGNA